MGGTQDHWTYLCRRGLSWRDGKDESMGVPSSACEGQRSWQVGKGLSWQPCPLHATQHWHLASMVSQALSASFLSCRTPYSCPFRLSFHSQQWFPPWIFTPNPIFQHPVPLCNRRHMIQARMSWAVAQTMHAALSLAFHRPSSALIPWRPISVPADSPTVMGFSPPSSASCQGCWSLFWFLFSVTFFILPDYE